MKTLREKYPHVVQSSYNQHEEFEWFSLLETGPYCGLMNRINFDAAVKELGGFSSHVKRLCIGYEDFLVIDPNAPDKVEIGDDIERSLEQYPVLDDDAYFKAEFEIINKYIENDLCAALQKEIDERYEFEGEFDTDMFTDSDLKNFLPENLYDYIHVEDSSESAHHEDKIFEVVDYSTIEMILRNESCVVEYHKQLPLPLFD